MKRAIVVGKFYPPHAGHSHLIAAAEAEAEQVDVIIADRPEFKIPGKLRQQWLAAMHPKVRILLLKDRLDDSDSPAWGKNTIKFLGYMPDAVFSSESYGEPYAAAMGCGHVSVDPKRGHVPCSATAIRRDPYAMWQFLSPDVRAYFALRVCLVGAESTGKTTLARALARHYQTNWVLEYGRLYTEQNIKDVFSHRWTDREFNHIAREQNRLEDNAAKTCNKVMICDTDAFATSIWYERYFNRRSPTVEAIAAPRQYDLYILSDINTPFEQDGWRDGEHLRQWMHHRFIDKMELWGKDYLAVSGTPEQRLAQATAAIDQLLKTRHRLAGQNLKSHQLVTV